MRRPLRLLVFSHSSDLGGSEQLLLQLVRELTGERGVACTVVVPAEGPLLAPLRSAGAEVWTWPASRWCSARPAAPAGIRRTLAAGASTVLRHLAAARSLAPDAVLSLTTVIPWGGLAAALLARPHLWYVTDFGPATLRRRNYFLPFDEVRRAMEEGSDRLITVSRAVRDLLFPDARVPPAVVHPHLPVPPVAPEEGENPQARPTRLAVFGNLRPSKGQWEAVAALAQLAGRGLPAELNLVGHEERGGEEIRAHAASLGVEERVRVLGFVPDQHPWIAGADVVLMPSHEETFSLVCLEALLHGKPLVATRVGGVVEIVDDGVSGLLVPPEDPEALAAAVERLIRQPELARRLGEEGRRRALRRFTSDGFSGEIRRMLDEVVTSGRRSAVPAALLAPLEALASEHQGLGSALEELRTALEDARTTLEDARTEREAERRLRTAAEEEAQRLARDRRTDEENLGAERRRRLAAEEEARRLAREHRRLAESRAFRLLQAWWRLARRLRRKP